ncbi:MAG TPA: GldG family protein [Vicinamibacteria bacterium]|nr:GldG family protein [Vicinamibacteria bacterium]
MKRAIDLLAPLGLLVVVGSLAWVVFTGRTLPGGPGPYLLAGFALALAHLVLRWEDVVGRLGRRQMKYGTNTAVLVVVVLVILGLVNYLVFRHTRRFDLTKGQRYSLSDQTRKVLAGLKEEVKVTYFARGLDLARGQERLKEFQSVTPKIQADFVDPVANPARAQAYDVRGPWPILVVEKGTSRERITNDTEQDITNALIKVTRDKKRTVCFAEGEGERSEDDTGERGLSAAKAALAKNQYETKKVLLLREKKVPAECTVLVVAGPEKDLLPEAVDAIRSFVKAGGKALVMVEPELKEAYPNLVALLKEWNIQAGKDIVVDVSGMGQLFGAGELTPIVAEYPYHEITKDFRVMTAFHMARSMEAGKGTVEGVTAQNLLQTSRESWAESDLSLKGRIEFNEGKDRRGPISLGAAATIRAPEPVPSPSPSPSPSPGAEPPPKAPEGRVVAIGDSDFASNALLGFQGNKDFFLNGVAWLSEDADLIAIRPKEPDDQRLFLTQQQQLNVKLIALFLLPGAFVVAGISTWWRRR